MSAMRAPAHPTTWTKTWLALALCVLAACQPAADPDGYTITVIADGVERDLVAAGPTVREALAEAEITLSEIDRVVPPEFTPLERGLVVQVFRVTEAFTITQDVISFERRTVRNEALATGETRLLQAGSNGLRELTERVTFEDGAPIDRRIVREVLLRAPVDEVVMVGSRGTLMPIPVSGTLVYASGGNPWVISGNSAVRRPLDASADLDGRVFAVSPDGRTLAYTRAAPVVTETNSTLLNTLWLVDLQRSGSRPVRTPVTSVLNLTWADDGRRFAYTTGERTGRAPGWQANNDLWIATVSAGDPLERERVLDSSPGGDFGWWGTQFAWSPSGEALAYARADGVGLVTADDGELRILAAFAIFQTYSDWVWTPAPAWSLDGRFVLAVLHGPPPERVAPQDSRVFDLWALDAEGGLAMKLAPSSGMWAYPVPADAGIAYLQALDPDDSAFGRYALYVMDHDGSNERRLFPAPGQPGLKPQRIAWSPGGREIAITYLEDIYLVDVATGTARQLTSDGQSASPQWVR
jgi:Tol biopolymer transport system component